VKTLVLKLTATAQDQGKSTKAEFVAGGKIGPAANK
jgi:hypothetical protein